VPPFLTSALDGGELSLSRSGHFTSVEPPVPIGFEEVSYHFHAPATLPLWSLRYLLDLTLNILT
jgi:hypothetical protein